MKNGRRVARWSLVAIVAIGAIAALAMLYPYLEVARFNHDVTGIDVSHYQRDIDWARVAKSGVAFAYIKATEGRNHADDRFLENWRGAAAVGIARGAYHFFKPCRRGEEQASNFIARVPKEEGALPPVLDVEDIMTCSSKAQTLDVIAEITAFLDAVEAHYGCRPLIYTTPEYERVVLQGRLENERYWARSIHLPPMYRQASWVFWQYQHRGRRDGIDGPVDLNAFRGTKEDFARFASGEGCGKGRQ